MSLTTHVLDTASGGGAAAMRVGVQGPEGIAVNAVLDAGGRATLIQNLVAGVYEISFHAGAYGNTFYDVIPVRFNVADPALHYHIPLILAPFGYSTYRGG